VSKGNSAINIAAGSQAAAPLTNELNWTLSQQTHYMQLQQGESSYQGQQHLLLCAVLTYGPDP